MLETYKYFCTQNKYLGVTPTDHQQKMDHTQHLMQNGFLQAKEAKRKTENGIQIVMKY